MNPTVSTDFGNCMGNGYVPVQSIAMNRGYAAFDFLKVVDRRPVFAERHVQRFFRTMATLRLVIPQDEQSVLSWIAQRAAEGEDSTFGLKLFAVPASSVEAEVMDSELHVVPVPMPAYPERLYTHGGTLLSFEYQRFLPEAKSTHYLPSIYWEPEVRRKGALEPLFHFAGNALETSRSNIFACIDGQVVTPGTGVLHGVTRSVVLEELQHSGIAYAERTLSMRELAMAQEVWVTSTTKGVAPIVAIDGQCIGDGQVGPLCRKLMQAYAERVRQD